MRTGYLEAEFTFTIISLKILYEFQGHIRELLYARALFPLHSFICQLNKHLLISYYVSKIKSFEGRIAWLEHAF